VAKFKIRELVEFSHWSDRSKKSTATVVRLERPIKSANYITIKFDNKEDSEGYGGCGTAEVWPSDIRRIKR